MSELYAKIRDDIKSAMKEKKPEVLAALRNLDSTIKNKIIEVGAQIPTDDHVIASVSSLVKRGKDSAEQFINGKREDLANLELFQVDVLKKYLPPQMSLDEIKALVAKTVEDVGAKTMADLGKVMRELGPKIKGIADGKTVQQVIKDLLQH
jgi:uncharacterized protein YqeY